MGFSGVYEALQGLQVRGVLQSVKQGTSRDNEHMEKGEELPPVSYKRIVKIWFDPREPHFGSP